VKVCVGIDVGSAAVKIAVCGTMDSPLTADLLSNKTSKSFFPADIGIPFLLSKDVPTRGEPVETVRALLDEFRKVFDYLEIAGMCATGSGGNNLDAIFNITFENNFKALAQSAGLLYPDVRTVLELGGESARYIKIDVSDHHVVRIVDYEKNGDCAAGTGAFIEQQAGRLKYSLSEVGDAVLQAEKAALIAGRCSVFAKTDMIHAQQKGYTPPAILRGLCEAVVRNFKSTVCKGKEIPIKVLFAGGLALNKGIVAALIHIFQLKNEWLIIPQFPSAMGAIGCALIERQRQTTAAPTDIAKSQTTAGRYCPRSINMAYGTSDGRLSPLSTENVLFLRDRVVPYTFEGKTLPIDVYLGIDIGSVSTNLALIDDHDNLIKEIYVRTEGRPIEVVNKGLRDIEIELGSRIRVRAVGTTGSGRELIGALVGADAVNDEISAHKTGALYISERLQGEKVDTIFEIGGQDSKFINIKDGVVVDFTMNEACAAGTGSFLEEQAERLGINIVKEFSDLAFRSTAPVQFGERCTVFIESDINLHIHNSVNKEDIIAGLAYSIALNYLNRVVRGRKIGDVIYFQGGTAYNDAVASAFAMLLKKRIIVPPHNGVLGAIGIAILARDKVKSERKLKPTVPGTTSFQNFRLDLSGYSTHQFTCKACSNFCEIQQVKIGKEKTHWGDKCSDKFRKNTKLVRKAGIPNLPDFHEKILLENYIQNGKTSKPRIGIPRSLIFYSRFPFFNTFFTELGFDVVISDPSNREVVDAGVEATVVEPCFPIKLANGHILNLLSKNVEYVMVPNVIDYEMNGLPMVPYACPWTITLPFVSRCQPAFESMRERFLIPTIHFSYGMERVKKELAFFSRPFGVSGMESNYATECAFEAQHRFESILRSKGAEVLNSLRENSEAAIVLVGRAYNVYDSTVNLNLAGKLRDYYGINVIPYDFFDLDRFHIHTVNENMYWQCGKQILQAALAVKQLPDAHIIFITNFKCGPDSYIKHYVEEASGKPFLSLQFDGHSNDAGIVTRCEAYLHSKGFLS